ncbi:MAG: DUF4136 domain-containing protein [Ignavibacteriaceae bacterium]|nr:DUF4136 domain-containing protein [Ignavibacteriaceae bacterium]
MRTSKYFFSLINLLTITFLLLGGCSSISVHQDYDPEYDFSNLKTFGFIPLSSEAGIDQLSADRLSSAIKTELLAKGYTLSEQADFGVALLFSSKTKTNVQSYGYGYGYGYYGRPGYGGMGGVDVTQYEEGTLVIDFVDMKENKLVWRGIGSGALSQSPSVEERTQRVNNAVNQILAQFPPTKDQE